MFRLGYIFLFGAANLIKAAPAAAVPLLSTGCAEADVETRVPDASNHHRTHIGTHVKTKVVDRNTDLHVDASCTNVKVVALLFQEMKCVALGPSGDAEAHRELGSSGNEIQNDVRSRAGVQPTRLIFGNDSHVRTCESRCDTETAGARRGARGRRPAR